jgi:hypothetical protein
MVEKFAETFRKAKEEEPATRKGLQGLFERLEVAERENPQAGLGADTSLPDNELQKP